MGAERPGPIGYGLPPGDRIRRTEEIRGLLRRGKRRRTSHLDVFFAASPASLCRFGLIVPKHGRTIVRRNRLKRRLRELGRIEVLPRLRNAGVALEVLVRARREAYDTTFRQLRTELIEVTEDLCSRHSSSERSDSTSGPSPR